MQKFFFVFLIFSAVTLHAQWEYEFHLSPNMVFEKYSVFKKRKPPSYNVKYNVGVGMDLRLSFSKFNGKTGISIGPSVGQYYFWNNQVKTVEYNFEYKENHLVNPLCINVGVGNFTFERFTTPGKFYYSAFISGGGAWIQNSIVGVKNNKSIYTTKWAPLYRISFICGTRLKKIGIPLMFCFYYCRMDGRSFNGLFY